MPLRSHGNSCLQHVINWARTLPCSGTCALPCMAYCTLPEMALCTVRPPTFISHPLLQNHMLSVELVLKAIGFPVMVQGIWECFG